MFILNQNFEVTNYFLTISNKRPPCKNGIFKFALGHGLFDLLTKLFPESVVTPPIVSVVSPYTLSLENHQDGVYLHRHGVTLSLQAILVC